MDCPAGPQPSHGPRRADRLLPVPHPGPGQSRSSPLSRPGTAFLRPLQVLTCGCHSPSGPKIALPNEPGACDRIWDSAIMAGRRRPHRQRPPDADRHAQADDRPGAWSAATGTPPITVTSASPSRPLAAGPVASDRGDSGVGPGPVRVPGWLAALWAPVRDEYQARFEQFMSRLPDRTPVSARQFTHRPAAWLVPQGGRGCLALQGTRSGRRSASRAPPDIGKLPGRPSAPGSAGIAEG